METLTKFVLMLRNGVYPCEHMNSWERFDESSLPAKKEFYSSLTMEPITDADYKHAKRVWEYFGIQNLGQYHDLYLQSDTLLFADVFEIFGNKCIEINALDPA